MKNYYNLLNYEYDLPIFFTAIAEAQPVSLWIGGFISAIQQTIIVFQIIYYRYIFPHKNYEAIDEEEDVSETTE